MAKKQIIKTDCELCHHSYDFHEIGAKGIPFLCRCKLHDRRSRFTTKDGCKDFKNGKKRIPNHKA